MNLLQLRERLQAILDDADGEIRFSDERLTDALNEAQNEACRRVDLLVDSDTAEICQIPLEAGVFVYPIDNRIIKIKRISYKNTVLSQGLVNEVHDEYMRDLLGEPRKFAMWAANEIVLNRGLDRVPEADDVLRLRVVRLPLQAMVNDTDQPEIDSRDHLALTWWAAFLLLIDGDPDTLDPQKAERFAQLFGVRFGNAVSAGAEDWRKRIRQARTQARFL